jgi:hypothetical protein
MPFDGVGEPWSYPMAGRLEERAIDSHALIGNPLGDPHRRPLLVQLPPAYDAEPDRRFPSIYVLQGFRNQVDMWRNRHLWQPNPPEELDARFASGAVPPAIVTYVDAWTRLGGSQFLDSPGTGRYATYVDEEVVPFVDGAYRTLAKAEHRALAGHSSGGFGAMVHAMRRPDLYGGFASHAGDGLFELCFLPEFGAAAHAIRDRYGGSLRTFVDELMRPPVAGSPTADITLHGVYAMAACFSADADGTVQLPFELDTGRLRPEVWDRWLAVDPVRMAPSHADALRLMRAIWLDAGRSDEYSLDLATQAFRAELAAAGVPDERVHFELYDGGHRHSSWRYPLAIGWLAERLG